MNRSGSTTGALDTNSLIDQVPVTMARRFISTSPEASADEAMSKTPPATGVPAARPVSAAARGVTVPACWSDSTTGGMRWASSPIP